MFYLEEEFRIRHFLPNGSGSTQNRITSSKVKLGDFLKKTSDNRIPEYETFNANEQGNIFTLGRIRIPDLKVDNDVP